VKVTVWQEVNVVFLEIPHWGLNAAARTRHFILLLASGEAVDVELLKT
jgi:hypothetical protein